MKKQKKLLWVMVFVLMAVLSMGGAAVAATRAATKVSPQSIAVKTGLLQMTMNAPAS